MNFFIASKIQKIYDIVTGNAQGIDRLYIAYYHMQQRRVWYQRQVGSRRSREKCESRNIFHLLTLLGRFLTPRLRELHRNRQNQ